MHIVSRRTYYADNRKYHAPCTLACRTNGLLLLAETLVECLSGGGSDSSAQLAGQVPVLQSWLDGIAQVSQVLRTGCALCAASVVIPVHGMA